MTYKKTSLPRSAAGKFFLRYGAVALKSLCSAPKLFSVEPCAGKPVTDIDKL